MRSTKCTPSRKTAVGSTTPSASTATMQTPTSAAVGEIGGDGPCWYCCVGSVGVCSYKHWNSTRGVWLARTGGSVRNACVALTAANERSAVGTSDGCESTAPTRRAELLASAMSRPGVVVCGSGVGGGGISTSSVIGAGRFRLYIIRGTCEVGRRLERRGLRSRGSVAQTRTFLLLL